MMDKIISQRDYRVIKANELIQKSRFSLSVQEQKIVLYIISKIKPTDTDFSEMELSVAEFCEVCGIDKTSGKNYADVKKAIKHLRDKSIWVKLESGDETLMAWVEKPYINENSGVIRIRLDKDMKPYLLQLKEKFTQFNLVFTLAMKSQYAIRLYELLKSYEWQHGKEFSIEELKSLLIAEKYNRFDNFKRRVIDVSIEEINAVSDLKVTYELRKTGKAYTSIIFSIKGKSGIIERMRISTEINKRLNKDQPDKPAQDDDQLSLW